MSLCQANLLGGNTTRRVSLYVVCDQCRASKLSRYRPEVLEGYNQSDVDEPIEPD